MLIALVALHLTFAVRGELATWSWQKSFSALLMGLAIPIVHYVGMAAVTFTPSPLANSYFAHSMSISELGVTAIGLVTLMLLGLVFLASFVDPPRIASGNGPPSRRRPTAPRVNSWPL